MIYKLLIRFNKKEILNKNIKFFKLFFQYNIINLIYLHIIFFDNYISN